MTWQSLQVSACGTHHLDECGQPAYAKRFDQVLRFHPPGLAPVRLDDEAWHVRDNGTSAYDLRFLRTFGFYEGLASVVSNDGWHHITSDGENISTSRYHWCGNFQQGRCAVRDNTGYYHIKPEGSAISAKRWRYAGDYRDGMAVVQTDNGCSTHIYLDGTLVHEKWFLDLDVFHKGFARARDKDGWMHVDIRAQPIYSRRFQAVEPFYNGQARVERFDGGLEVISENGDKIVELRCGIVGE